eukprot:TRINITY_DN14487_c0_g3_i1.p1 TRINITY_DN14487_c0_g3~~TRINITY_DN14487_c0_g3_i1.p1  ORF type:complete len:106 (+),score=8.64 TRINITY_DN14487_c0_g3_i1:81-398(+)
MSLSSDPIKGLSSGLLVLDKTCLLTIQDKLSSQFVSIQTKINVTSEFDHLCCLDFALHSKVNVLCFVFHQTLSSSFLLCIQHCHLPGYRKMSTKELGCTMKALKL